MSDIPALALHESAAAAFNSKTEALIQALSVERPREVSSVVPPEAFVSRKIPAESVITEGIVKHHADVANRVTGKFFHDKGRGWIGLEGSEYRRLVELAEAMQRRREFRPHLSSSFLEDQIFLWLKGKYFNEVDATAVEHIIQVGSGRIADLEVWLPIPTLSVTVPFSVGNVEFKPISGDLIDRWQSNAKPHEHADQYFAKVRKKFQGLAAATMRVVAEPVRAREIAFEEAEKSTAALRLFSPEILHPYGRSYWEPLGFLDPAGFDVFLTQNGNLRFRQSWMSPDKIRHSALDEQKVIAVFSMGLSKVDALLRNDQPTPFQKKCLDALFQYSRAALKRDPSEKLLYIISALESVLLSGTHEGGIGKNLEERLAVFIRSDLRERLNLMERVRAIYRLRSNFVHHSLPVKDLELMKSFMLDAMAAFGNLLIASSVYRNKEEFIRDLDLHRLAGPSYRPLRFGAEQGPAADA